MITICLSCICLLTMESRTDLAFTETIDNLSDSASIEAVDGLSDSASTDNLSDLASTATLVNPTNITYDDHGSASMPPAATTISSAVESQEPAMQIPPHNPAPASSIRSPLSSFSTMSGDLLLICHLIILTHLVFPTITFIFIITLVTILIGNIGWAHSAKRKLFIACLKMVLLVYLYASVFSFLSIYRRYAEYGVRSRGRRIEGGIRRGGRID